MVVKAMIINGDKALLLRRSKKEIENSFMHRQEAWDLPGGGVRFFETAEKGLVREIAEETGLDVNVIKPLSMYDAIRNQLHLSILTYLCEYKGGEVVLSSEHEAHFWMDGKSMVQSDVPKWMARDFFSAVKEYDVWKKENE